MRLHISVFVAAMLLGTITFTAAASAQSHGDRGRGLLGWRMADGSDSSSRTTEANEYFAKFRDRSRRTSVRLTQFKTTDDGFPRGNAGQVYVEYPIDEYTSRVTWTKRPEQAVIDWILRETGYEAWHSNTVACLCADRQTLKVYHTREMQNIVEGVVRRFVNNASDTRAFCLRVVTLDEPDWRARAYRLLKPIPVQTQGVQAWLLQREEAAILLAELAKRSDYREPPEYNAQPAVANGQSYVMSNVRFKNYVRDLSLRSRGIPGLQPLSDQLNEGLALEFSPLLSADGKMVDAVLKCHIDQVEQLRRVTVEVQTASGKQTGRIDVPQVSQFRLQERFRWPVDQVLLVGLGIVPAPHQPTQSMVNLKSLRNLNFGAPPPSRAEVLVFIECKCRHAHTPVGGKSRTSLRRPYHNRY